MFKSRLWNCLLCLGALPRHHKPQLINHKNVSKAGYTTSLHNQYNFSVTSNLNFPVHVTCNLNFPVHVTSNLNFPVHVTSNLNFPVHVTSNLNFPVHVTSNLNFPVYVTSNLNFPVHVTSNLNFPVHVTSNLNFPVHNFNIWKKVSNTKNLQFISLIIKNTGDYKFVIWRALGALFIYRRYFGYVTYLAPSKPSLYVSQMKHQLDSTLYRLYFCRVTLHVSGASAHHQEYLKKLVRRPLVRVLSLQVSHHITLLGPNKELW